MYAKEKLAKLKDCIDCGAVSENFEPAGFLDIKPHQAGSCMEEG